MTTNIQDTHTIQFEYRNVNGNSMQVAVYEGNLYRLDKSDDTRPYVGPYTTAEFKYFTTNKTEAISAYSRYYQKLRVWKTLRPLILLNLFDIETRQIFRNTLNETTQTYLNFSFPIQEGVVSRRSLEGHTEKNYGVTKSLCDLFAIHGIDGYYIPASPGLHSEVALCGNTLREDSLIEIHGERNLVSAPSLKRGKVTKRNYNRARRTNRNNRTNRSNRTKSNNKNNNNNNNNNIMMPKIKRSFGPLSFNNVRQ